MLIIKKLEYFPLTINIPEKSGRHILSIVLEPEVGKAKDSSKEFYLVVKPSLRGISLNLMTFAGKIVKAIIF